MSGLQAVNRAHIVLLAAIVLLGSGYGYWKYMYTPTKATLATATERRRAADEQVSAKRSQLIEIETKEKAESAKKSLGTIIVANEAVPQEQDAAEAMAQVSRMARLVDVTVEEQSIQPNQGAGADATATTVSITGHAPYTGIAQFLAKIQDTVSARAGKLYVKGRLMNITSLHIEGADDAEGSTSTDLPVGHVKFTILIEVYAAAPAAGSTTTASTPAPTDGSTPSTTTPGSTTTTPGSTTPTTPGSTTPTTPGSTTPTTPSTTTPTTPASSSTPPESS